jgi:hypothetical protein
MSGRLLLFTARQSWQGSSRQRVLAQSLRLFGESKSAKRLLVEYKYISYSKGKFSYYWPVSIFIFLTKIAYSSADLNLLLLFSLQHPRMALGFQIVLNEWEKPWQYQMNTQDRFMPLTGR